MGPEYLADNSAAIFVSFFYSWSNLRYSQQMSIPQAMQSITLCCCVFRKIAASREASCYVHRHIIISNT